MLRLSGPLWASLGLRQPTSQPPSQPASQARDRFPGRNSASQPASQFPGRNSVCGYVCMCVCIYVCMCVCTYVHIHLCTRRGPESLSVERTSHLGAFFGLLELFRCLLVAYVCMDVRTGPPFFVCFQQKMMTSWNCRSNCRSEQAPRGPETRREPQRGTETHREANFEGGTLSFRIAKKTFAIGSMYCART